MKSAITAHMLIKNEEQWVWYAVQSVLPSVEKCFIFDTSSTDKTLEIIKSIPSPKIILEEKGEATRERLIKLRNEMKDRTETDWFLLVDGDEIWPRQALAKLTDAIHNSSEEVQGLVVRTRNCVGDVWHYQPESAGRYKLLGREGHLTIRAYRNLPGFRWRGKYPNEAYCDTDGNPINHQDEHLRFVDTAFWHVTHLARSGDPKRVIDRGQKRKLEIGKKTEKDELPEVFSLKRPKIVPSPWIGLGALEHLAAILLTPLRRIKRLIIR